MSVVVCWFKMWCYGVLVYECIFYEGIFWFVCYGG